MSYNSPVENIPYKESPHKDSKKLIYSLFILALILTWGYIIYDKSKATETVQQLQTHISTTDSSKVALQMEFNTASAKVDSLAGSNVKLNGTLTEKSNQIQKLKSNIAGILRKKNATSAELADAKKMIDEMNSKVTELYAQIEQLKGENQSLTADKVQLTTDKEELSKQKDTIQQNLQQTTADKLHVEDVASTLHASAINVEAITVKNSGKEKETTTAKRANMLRVTFKLDENRIAPTGQKDLYVCVTNPDGSSISKGETVTTREDGDKKYTDKVSVNYEQGKAIPVSFEYKNNDSRFQTGSYKVEIYQNGYKIGEGNKTLKKGGLFAKI